MSKPMFQALRQAIENTQSRISHQNVQRQKAPPSGSLSPCCAPLNLRTTQGFSTAAPAPFPAWARAANAPESEAEAAFLAGAALSRLDAVVRSDPPWAGVWRRRLALAAAAASLLRAGRTEDEARLRDAFHLTRPGADPGPAGEHLFAWRELVARSAGQWRSSSRSPPRSWGSQTARPCRTRSPPPGLAPAAAGRRRSPRRASSASSDAP